MCHSPPPPPPRHTWAHTHRHGGISRPRAPPRGLGAISSPVGLVTGHPGTAAQSGPAGKAARTVGRRPGEAFTQPNPTQPNPLLGRRDGEGGSGQGCPTCRGGGGGVNPTSMAQNDTHVALIILTTQMWGGGNYWWKKNFRAKICVPPPLAPTSVLTQNKGPNTERHFSNPPPPPSFGGCPCHPPQSNFQVAQASYTWRLHERYPVQTPLSKITQLSWALGRQ